MAYGQIVLSCDPLKQIIFIAETTIFPSYTWHIWKNDICTDAQEIK